ncbi:MAG: ribosomal protein S18-alanine N-acetyltransferase [Gammaproteobacteria bacterium]
MHIRSMQAADVDRVMEIEADGYDFPWTPAIFLDCIEAGYRCAVVTCDEHIVAYAIVTVAAGEAHLLNLCVHSDRRGQGCASLLLSHLLLDARQAGARDIFLEVRPSNDSAVRLYQRYGFRSIGTRPDYYRALGGREDALVLTRSLDDVDAIGVFTSLPVVGRQPH